MYDSKIHWFDVRLCDNIARNLNAGLEARGAEGEEFRTWVARQLGDCPLLHYLQDRGEGLLLSDDELRDINSSVGFGPWRIWWPWPRLYARYSACLVEIRQLLAGSIAEAFALSSARRVRLLAKERLSLEDALPIVNDWISEIRQLKRDMGTTWALPQPEGGSQTPSVTSLRQNFSSEANASKRITSTMRANIKIGTTLVHGSTSTSTDCELTPKQGAILLTVSERQFYRLIEAGRIPAVNVGVGKSKTWRVKRADVEQFRNTPENIRVNIPCSTPELPPYVRSDLLDD